MAETKKEIAVMNLDDVCTYRIAVHDGMDAETLNASSPLQLTVLGVEASATFLAVRADQSALIGLLRYLHQQGYLLLSVCRDSLPRAELT